MVWVVLFLGLGGMWLGCRSAAPEPPIEGEVVFGQGGGFTGLYSGHVVRSDGVVFRWSQMPGQEERREEVGRVPPDSLRPFFRQLLSWEQQGLQVSGAGNMTAFVELRQGQKRYRLQWGLGEDVPAGVREFYAELLSFLRRHLP